MNDQGLSCSLLNPPFLVSISARIFLYSVLFISNLLPSPFKIFTPVWNVIPRLFFHSQFFLIENAFGRAFFRFHFSILNPPKLKNNNSSEERYSVFFYSLFFEKNSFPFFTPGREVRRPVSRSFRTKHRSGFLCLAERKPTGPNPRRTETGRRQNCDGKLAGDARLANQIPAAPGPITGRVFFVSPRGSQRDRTQDERRPDGERITAERSSDS